MSCWTNLVMPPAYRDSCLPARSASVCGAFSKWPTGKNVSTKSFVVHTRLELWHRFQKYSSFQQLNSGVALLQLVSLQARAYTGAQYYAAGASKYQSAETETRCCLVLHAILQANDTCMCNMRPCNNVLCVFAVSVCVSCVRVKHHFCAQCVL